MLGTLKQFIGIWQHYWPIKLDRSSIICMNLVIRGLIIFVILLISSSLLIEYFNQDFGDINFFDKRGFFFLFFITVFPRLTLLFSSVPFGGLAWWLGFIFCPRILVAILATINYFQTNPILVVMSWLIALGGESFEKWRIGRGSHFVFSYNLNTNNRQTDNARSSQIDGDTIEAEYKRKS